jgi:hypothetical protein
MRLPKFRSVGKRKKRTRGKLLRSMTALRCINKHG